MKILSTTNNKNDVTFKIEVDGNQWKEEFNKTKKNIAKNINIQGFRKGHVPTSIVDERVTPEQIAYQTLDKSQNNIIQELIKTKEFSNSNCLDSVNNIEIVELKGSEAPILNITFDLLPKVLKN